MSRSIYCIYKAKPVKYNSIFHRVKYKEDRILFARFIAWNWPYIYITNKLHHRKCFVRILFTRCKTLETHSFATLTRSFLKFCDSWIKTRTVHFLWSNICNCTVFLPQRFHWPIYFYIKFPWNETPVGVPWQITITASLDRNCFSLISQKKRYTKNRWVC